MTPKPPNLPSETKITQAEMVEMFGETMPREAVILLTESLGKMTLGEMRAKLREIADNRAPSPPSLDVEREADADAAERKMSFRRKAYLGWLKLSTPARHKVELAYAAGWDAYELWLASRPRPEPELPGEVAELVERLEQEAQANRGTLNCSSAMSALLDEAAALLTRLAGDNDRLRASAAKVNEEICQTLGAALGYPRFVDDQKNFPGATVEQGVCVGEHVAETLAVEAVARLAGDKGERTAFKSAEAEWNAFDRVLMMLNGLAVSEGQTADQMRRKVYGEVMSMKPDLALQNERPAPSRIGPNTRSSSPGSGD